MPATSDTDVVIIGGGPSGLSAAANLARALHTVVVLDSQRFRNDLWPHLHGVPGWDHEAPAAVRTRMQKDLLARYNTTRIVNVTAVRAEKVDGGLFAVTDEKGDVWRGRKLVLATGVTDLLPEIPGYEECWVKGIFHCLMSQGFEVHGQETAGVFGIDECANLFTCARLSKQARQLSSQVRIYTDANAALIAELEAADITKNKTNGIVLENRKVVGVRKEPHGSAVTVLLEDGTELTEGFVVHKPKMLLNGDFARQLGCEVLEYRGEEMVKTEPPFHETGVKGVFAVGDCASPYKIVVNAVSMGSFACAGMAAQLQMESG